LDLAGWEFVNTYASLTGIQRQEFIASVLGKTVDWSCGVFRVEADGTILVDCIDWSMNVPIGAVTYLKHVPVEISKFLHKDDPIRFTGSIESVQEIYGSLVVSIINVQIINDILTFRYERKTIVETSEIILRSVTHWRDRVDRIRMTLPDIYITGRPAG
jgi:hypothetical protein